PLVAGASQPTARPSDQRQKAAHANKSAPIRGTHSQNSGSRPRPRAACAQNGKTICASLRMSCMTG
ncbi:MAG: hypothetical protein KH319_06365, partial [Butyricicoccus pullicaecorum]|nr:hypothetical protein [Butyricicoccus pullicaecorum]